MEQFKISKVSDIHHACIDTAPDGYFVIKPRSRIIENGYDTFTFDNVILWNNHHSSPKRHGPVYFGDTTWISNETTQRNLTFIDDNSEFALQLKLYAMVRHFYGLEEGGNAQKLSTLQTKITAYKKMAIWLANRSYNSFHDLAKLPEIKLRTLLHDFVTEVVMENSPSSVPRVYNDCFDPKNSLGLIDQNVSTLLHEILDQKICKSDKSLSHPIIPTRIAQQLASLSKLIVDECESRLGDLEILNAKLVRQLKENKGSYYRKAWEVPDLIGDAANQTGVKGDLDKLNEYFTDLRLAVYIHILLFTGMRYNEVLTCEIGCTERSDEKRGVFLVEAETHKTVEHLFLDTWNANEDTVKAISILERYNCIMAERATTLLECFRHLIPKSSILNLKGGLEEQRLFGTVSSSTSISYAKAGRFTKFEVKSPHFYRHLDLTITADDLAELERLDLNYSQIRGENRAKPYCIGDTLRISNHMFRHTFAYFVVANKLGEFDDIAEQFKHLSMAMTKVYGDKGILSYDELTDLVDGFENVLVQSIASELSEQASDEALRGGAGERFNKAAQSLIIGVTDSNSPNAEVIRQVHFKDYSQFKAFLAKNIETIRGLPHGYCLAGDACKMSGAAVPAGCVYCGSFIVAEIHKVHWRAVKKRAEDRLHKISALPYEQQKEMGLFKIMHEKDLKAANYALNSEQQDQSATVENKL